MDNTKGDEYYIKKVIANINMIISYSSGLSYDEFIKDELIIDAIMFRLIQMVENTNRISKEYKERHSDIDWNLIKGFRNGIVHEYGNTDYAIVYEIVTSDIHDLKRVLLSENKNI